MSKVEICFFEFLVSLFDIIMMRNFNFEWLMDFLVGGFLWWTSFVFLFWTFYVIQSFWNIQVYWKNAAGTNYWWFTQKLIKEALVYRIIGCFYQFLQLKIKFQGIFWFFRVWWQRFFIILQENQLMSSVFTP